MASTAGNLTSADLSRQQTGMGQLGSLATTGQTLGINDINALLTSGAQQQGNEQSLLSTAYQQWQQQQQYPQQNLGWMAGLLSGTPTQGTVSTTTDTGTYNPSSLDRGISTAAGLASIYNTLFGE